MSAWPGEQPQAYAWAPKGIPCAQAQPARTRYLHAVHAGHAAQHAVHQRHLHGAADARCKNPRRAQRGHACGLLLQRARCCGTPGAGASIAALADGRGWAANQQALLLAWIAGVAPAQRGDWGGQGMGPGGSTTKSLRQVLALAGGMMLWRRRGEHGGKLTLPSADQGQQPAVTAVQWGRPPELEGGEGGQAPVAHHHRPAGAALAAAGGRHVVQLIIHLPAKVRS